MNRGECMGLQIPDSMEELVYWTSRKINKGAVKAWVNREQCPECHKALMGKPSNNKGGIKIRASFYECPECHYKVDKQEYEDTLTANIIYTCSHCSFNGETQIPYKRKKFQGVDALIFTCQKCSQKIPITKKLKSIGDKSD
jgi:hypothetical protein